ncbi:outer membrane protein assembly factor BamB family protein [Chthoniobacter flavus]|uniref:outer membrane protein assembly factor BamB family protein n=1 Tax=Chthoniobacter flavus TaxID=191863 RepID=UPI001404DF9B|nr:PQQ-binding-like beta-propeller repeat protein [Chthoniobacter flavus]
MFPAFRPSSLALIAAVAINAFAAGADWPQFRGPGGLGIGTGQPAIEFGPEKNVVWKIDVPFGHSSPCIVGNKLFLTGFDGGKLVTLCFDRADGHELWRAVAPADKIEPMHRIASAASPTPCSDGERVYVYFGSAGLLAYDLQGKEVWHKPLPIPLVEFGTGASPILADGKVVIVCDQDMGSYLLAVDAKTGQQAWRVERPGFLRSFSSPFLWKHDGTEEIVVVGALLVKSYAVKDGHELWSCQGTARVSNATPVAGDGMLLVSSWNVGGDAGARITMAPFEEFLAANDANHDGVLTKEEFPPGPIRDRFSQMDVNKDGKVTREEYEHMRDMFSEAVNQMFAIRPGGHGDITKTNVLWSVSRHLPYVSSPLLYDGRVYAVKNGGLASCYDAHTGEIVYQAERLDVPGDYYSSAVAADGRVYVTSQKGTVVVIDAGRDVKELKVLARNAIGEPVFATPALVDGRIFLRTDKHLFAFGEN